MFFKPFGSTLFASSQDDADQSGQGIENGLFNNQWQGNQSLGANGLVHSSPGTQDSTRMQGVQSGTEQGEPAPVYDSPYGRPPLTPEQTRNGYARMFGVDPSTLRTDRLEIRDDAYGGRPPLTAEQTREDTGNFLKVAPLPPRESGGG